MGLDLSSTTCALRGVVKFPVADNVASVYLDPNYRDPYALTKFCFPTATSHFLVGIVDPQDISRTLRTAVLQIEPHGRYVCICFLEH